MIPDSRFENQAPDFWAHVRTISERVGYTARGRHEIKVPSADEMRKALVALGLGVEPLFDHSGPTVLGSLLASYFEYRAALLNTFVEPRLMDAERARAAFEELVQRYQLRPDAVPWNKQSGNKRAPAYFTAIINILVRAHAQGQDCDFDPRGLTTITRDGRLVRTLARRVDGAFPSVVNPIAVWEIKEYYYTTTFGSRVADGIYESLLDGMELNELRRYEGISVAHYLMVDSHYTWWQCGRSYLCRLIDLLHMGYLTEVLFGDEVLERLPVIVAGWVDQLLSKTGSPGRDTLVSGGG